MKYKLIVVVILLIGVCVCFVFSRRQEHGHVSRGNLFLAPSSSPQKHHDVKASNDEKQPTIVNQYTVLGTSSAVASPPPASVTTVTTTVVAPSGQANDIAAQTNKDSLSLVSGQGIALDMDTLTKQITISAATGDVLGLLPIINGGTGATSAAMARSNLGLVPGGPGDIWVKKAGDQLTGNLENRNGSTYRVYNSNNTKYVTFSQDDFWARVTAGGTSNSGFVFSGQRIQFDGAQEVNVNQDLMLIGANTRIKTNSNKILTLLPNGAGYTRIGDAGSSSRSFTTNDDLFVSGRLEIDGMAYFDNGMLVAGTAQAKKYHVATDDKVNVSFGKGKLASGSAKVTIDTTVVSSDSGIFTTAESPIRTPLFISEKVPGKSFTVEMVEVAANDVSFNWWIVN